MSAFSSGFILAKIWIFYIISFTAFLRTGSSYDDDYLTMYINALPVKASEYWSEPYETAFISDISY